MGETVNTNRRDHMTETLRVIAERYSCRSFTGKMPVEEQLRKIAEAGAQAPSSLNRQRWKIIVVRNQGLIQAMETEGMQVLKQQEDTAMYQSILDRGGKLFYHAPCMIVIAIEPSDPSAYLDCGIVCENIALSATSLGLGNVICGLARLAFSAEKAEVFKEQLGFPAGYEFGMAILLGYPEVITNPHKPDLHKISYID